MMKQCEVLILRYFYESTKNQMLTYSSFPIMDEAYTRLQNVDNNAPVTHDTIALAFIYGHGQAWT